MSAIDPSLGEMPKARKPRKMAIFGMGLLFFAILTIVAVILCNFRVEYVTQSILNSQRDNQQTWMDKSMDAIRVWRNQVLEQARYISSAELFRLFVLDTRSFTPEELARLGEPDSLHSGDDAIRSMAEQLTYIQDLLSDFTRRRAWNDARILLPDGVSLVEPRFSTMLAKEQVDLAKKAGEDGKAVFGPVRKSDKGLVMELAEPLFEVLGENTKPVAVLLLSLPMEKPLTSFLSLQTDHISQTMLPRIVFRGAEGMEMALSKAGAPSIEPAKNIDSLEPLSFAERPALDGRGNVYSLGAALTGPAWLFALETPQPEIAAIIHDQKIQIYGLGILSSIGIALLAAFLWAALTSKSHEARAKLLEKLYTTIRNQKIMLDSVNASMKAGLVLVDSHFRVLITNPAFNEICHRQKIEDGTPISELLPDMAGIVFMEKMAQVIATQSPGDAELRVPDQDGGLDGEKLYRVSFFYFADAEKGDDSNGCVAIFQDITRFRQAAILRQNRNDALLCALGSTVESFDPNLMGNSDKMAKLGALLREPLNLSPADAETLNLAIRLSQVGKMFVPRELLTKKDKLTPEELAEVRRAPEYADKILSLPQYSFDLPVRASVRMMSERLDGSGYFGMKGDEISRVGRVLAIINAFVGMTGARGWRSQRMSVAEAIVKLRENPGFDQEIVNSLASLPPDRIQEILDSGNQESNEKE